MWIRRLGEERELPRGERDIGWRKHAGLRPRHVGDTILVEQGPALVVGFPRCRSVHDRLVIQQATERLPPVEEAMIRSVLASGGAEADAFARAGEVLRIDQPIQL